MVVGDDAVPPQHRTVPPDTIAQPLESLTETAVAPVTSWTVMGAVAQGIEPHVSGPVFVVSSTWPSLLAPQHFTVPPDMSAQAEKEPAEMAIARSFALSPASGELASSPSTDAEASLPGPELSALPADASADVPPSEAAPLSRMGSSAASLHEAVAQITMAR
jgi:hypothetical protein